MRKIIYYVAASLDGFIAGPEEDISKFIPAGPGVDQYLADLQRFDTVIMGRRTYEFGYRFGLVPGQPAYPHMKHYIFSNNLQLEESHELVKVVPVEINQITSLRQSEGTDIYLCGGGSFAGWLLQHQLIDQLKLKLNPVLLGAGIRLFGETIMPVKLNLTESKRFDDGLQILSYDFVYN